MLALLALAGCKPSPQGNCVNMMPGAVLAAAQSLRLDVYPESVACVGNGVGPNAGMPSLTQTFAKGEAVKLDVPPGKHTLVLLAFSDANAMHLIGSGCVAADLQPGTPLCVDLQLTPSGDASVPHDMATCGGDGGPPCTCAGDGDCHDPGAPRCGPNKTCVPCVAQSDNCPPHEYCTNGNACAPGCKDDNDCAGTGPDAGVGDGGMPAMTPFCKTDKHQCVECRDANDCGVGQVCSPSGACVEGCDLQQGKGCKPGFSCCNKLCIDTRSDALNCGGCGMQCLGNNTRCCNAQCTNPLTDVANCGSCGNTCNSLNAAPSCANGTCAWQCNQGFAHCQMGNTGCETATNTLANCGGCGNACDVSNAASAACDGKKCGYVCKPGFGDCVQLGADVDGCESMLNTTQNCGGCGNLCNGVNATAAMCDGTKCSYTCKQGFANCVMMGANLNGCETDLTKPSNCGGCGMICDTVQSVGALCTMGNCTYTGCKPGFADCMKAMPNYDGCETPTNTPANCGGCGVTCALANANSASCDGTKCSYMCKVGFGDCQQGGANTDGCETATNTVTNCGGCGNVCNGVNANSTSCINNVCSYMCKPGFGNCVIMGADTDGCETNIATSVTNCGGCGKACDMVNSNGAVCAGGACAYQGCKAGFADCVNAAPDLDGCETAITTTVNCGGCGNVCNLVNANSASCVNGKCVYQCKPGFSDCTMNGANTDGCETALNSIANCGACGNACNVANANSATCTNGVCSYMCKPGFSDCVMMGANTDGCETNTVTDFRNCGGCNKACDLNHSIGASCVNSACVYQGCAINYADCVTTAPDLDGCETNTTVNNNCGGCGNVCNPANAAGASCDGIRCSYTCNAGFGDCVKNGANTDGCETALNTLANCGACGSACDQVHSLGAACNGVKCTYTGCVNGWVDCDMSGTNANGCDGQVHINGLGQTFMDCVDAAGTPGNPNTYNLNMATLARAAWPLGAPSDTAGFCGGNNDMCVARGNNSECSVWCYTGASSGYVHHNNMKMCLCPTPGVDPVWY